MKTNKTYGEFFCLEKPPKEYKNDTYDEREETMHGKIKDIINKKVDTPDMEDDDSEDCDGDEE